MSMDVYSSFQRYQAVKDPIAFAVTADGKKSHWHYCIEFGCVPNRFVPEVIGRCEQRHDEPCFIFALADEIVWQNPGDWKPKELGQLTSTDPKVRREALVLWKAGEPGFRTYSGRTGHRAFAIAWDIGGTIKGWGTSYKRKSAANAVLGAIEFCGRTIGLGNTPCTVIDVNGTDTFGRTTEELLVAAKANEFSKSNEVARQVVFSWTGVGEDLIAEILNTEGQGRGSFEFSYPEDTEVTCNGTYNYVSRSSGVWAFACDNSVSADGDFARVGGTDTFVGTGKDTEGRAIKISVGQAG